MALPELKPVRALRSAPDPLPRLPKSAALPAWIIAGAAVWFTLAWAKPVLLPIALAVLLAAVLAIPVRHLKRHHIPEAIGAAIVLAVLAAAVVLVFAAVAKPAMQWAERAPRTLQQLTDLLAQAMHSLERMTRDGAAAAAAPGSGPLADRLTEEGLVLTRVALVNLQDFVLGAASMLVLLYFLLASGKFFLRALVRALPEPRAKFRAVRIARALQSDIAHYFATMSLINVGLGAATGLALAALGMPNPTLWAMLVAALTFIPYLGPAVLVAVLGIAGAVAFHTPQQILAVPLVFLGLHVIESQLVSPVVMGRRMALNPAVIIAAVMAWGWIWGILGTLIAVPVLLAAKVLCRHVPSLARYRGFLARDDRADGTAYRARR